MSDKRAATLEEQIAIDEIASKMLLEHRRALYSLGLASEDIHDSAYRLQAGRVQGMQVALSTLQEHLDIGLAARGACELLKRNPLKLTT